jgi:hypothetical protein
MRPGVWRRGANGAAPERARARSWRRNGIAVFVGLLLLLWALSGRVPTTPGAAASLPRALRAGASSSSSSDVAAADADGADATALYGICIFTSYAGRESAARRAAIAATWLPTPEAAQRLRLAVRFVVGDAPTAATSVDAERAAAALALEVSPVKLMHLRGVHDTYAALSSKTAAFITAAARLWPAALFVLKVDDDVYLRPGVLPLLAPRWAARGADYIGCMKSHAIQRNASLKWAEPRAMHLGDENYFVHAWGSAYALSRRALTLIAALPPGALRQFANEDVSVGAWALALSVRLLDERRLCAATCDEGADAAQGRPGAALAVWEYRCTGLCDAPTAMRQLHQLPACTHVPPHNAPLPSLAEDDDAAFFPFAVLNALPPQPADAARL